MMQYATIQGDTWDGISFKLFGDERFAALLMEQNPGHIRTSVFSAGVLLDVPVIPAQQAATLPPWKRGE